MPCIRLPHSTLPVAAAQALEHRDTVTIWLDLKKAQGLALLAEGLFDSVKLTQASRASIQAGLASMSQSADPTIQAMSTLRILELIEELVDADLLSSREQSAIRTMLQSKVKVATFHQSTSSPSPSENMIPVVIPATDFFQIRSIMLSSLIFTPHSAKESLNQLDPPRIPREQSPTPVAASTAPRILISAMCALTGLISLYTAITAEHMLGERFNQSFYFIPALFILTAVAVGATLLFDNTTRVQYRHKSRF